MNRETVTIELERMYREGTELGDCLSIREDSSKLYYDLIGKDGRLLACDGEECRVVSTRNGEVMLIAVSEDYEEKDHRRKDYYFKVNEKWI